MGSVSTHHGTELDLIRSEVGLDSGYSKLIRKAAGGTLYGEKRTWLILEGTTGKYAGKRVLVLALTNRSKAHGVWCKIIEESMGFGETDVPDSIWNNLPPDPGGYATHWRASVAAFRAEWPLTLDKVPVGATVVVNGHKASTWTRVEGSYKGSPLYTNGYRVTRFSGWKSARAKLV